MGRVFRKAFRILGLGERKGRWAMEQDFHGDFQVNVTWFFACFSGVLVWIVLILVWFERSLHSAQVRGQICRKDEDPHGRLGAVRGGYGRLGAVTGGYGRFRGEWINPLNPTIHVQILQTDVHTFPLRPRRENLIKDQSASLRWSFDYFSQPFLLIMYWYC